MFDFLFKRSTKPVTAKVIAITPVAASVAQATRESARSSAQNLQDDESASLRFLLDCEFADARLIAAQAIHSPSAMQQVLNAMRNTDRRVAKLMQARLDLLQRQQQQSAQALACIATARRLRAENHLLPNQITALDGDWAALGTVPLELAQQFAGLRTELADRLSTQAALQRALIDLLRGLQALPAQASQIATTELHAKMAQATQALLQHRGSAECAAVPKQLFAQCDQALEQMHAQLASIEQQHAARDAFLDQLLQWESADPATLKTASLHRSWQALPQAQQEAAQLAERFNQLMQRVTASQPAPVARVPAAESSLRLQHADFANALQALQQAMEQGVLQDAAQADKRLRAFDLSAISPTHDETTQLAQLRAELARLQGWARWGGNISREELQKAAIGLPEQDLSLPELAKKIGGLRAQWKALDRSAGAAPHALWSSFDAACMTAYAPVAGHFKLMGEQRQKNSAQAIALIADLNQRADQLSDQSPTDWKALGIVCQQSLQAWQKIGTLERTTKKTLESQFTVALQRLREPLQQARSAEIDLREQMIAEVGKLDAQQTRTLDTVRSLQQRWQDRAKALPLERHDEQALWQQFRAACDAVFAQRKEISASADAQRRTHLTEKEAICEKLEKGLNQVPDTLRRLLREAADAWSRSGAVPRPAEAAIEKRYHDAVAAIEQVVDAAQRQQAEQARQAIWCKLSVCQQFEADFAASDKQLAVAAIDAAEARWQSLAVLPAAIEKVLNLRFAQAITASRQGDADYLALLQAGRAPLHREILRLEIQLAIESPVELARERLQLQVDVLQAVLKSAKVPVTDTARLASLCTLPALVDAPTALRLQRIVERLSGALQ